MTGLRARAGARERSAPLRARIAKRYSPGGGREANEQSKDPGVFERIVAGNVPVSARLKPMFVRLTEHPCRKGQDRRQTPPIFQGP